MPNDIESVLGGIRFAYPKKRARVVYNGMLKNGSSYEIAKQAALDFLEEEYELVWLEVMSNLESHREQRWRL